MTPAHPPALHASEEVAAAPWFACLDTAQQALVRATAASRDISPGECLARVGDPSLHWIGVVRGLLHMSVTTADGNETTLHFVREGEWGGEGSLLKHEARRYAVVAVTPSRVCLLPVSTFDLLLAQSVPFNHFLLANLNSRMGVITSLLEASRLLDPEIRVERCLAMLAEGGGGRPLALAQHQLASLCGLSRQRTNMALQALRARGAVRMDGHDITVVA